MHLNIPELLVFFVWYFLTLRCYFLDYRSYYINFNLGLWTMNLKRWVRYYILRINVKYHTFWFQRSHSKRGNYPRDIAIYYREIIMILMKYACIINYTSLYIFESRNMMILMFRNMWRHVTRHHLRHLSLQKQKML